MQRRLALQGGQGLADAYRNVDIQAAMQRNADAQNFMALMQNVLGPQYQWDRDIANAYLGAASNGVWQQKSAGEKSGTGVGQITGGILGGMFGGPAGAAAGSAAGGAATSSGGSSGK